MSKPNTRQYDRIIRDATSNLQGVRRRKTWALTAGEQAKLAAYGTFMFAKATRLKSSPMADRGMAGVWSQAEQRLQAEIAAAERAKQAVISQAADAKLAKRAESRWW
ncbi:hypothetical protein ACFV90_40820 [Streptomyces sp. NPDC059904]|uniref:hypothetical protein n=1 Tax=Streptomyces sp. NPDC059904 TaxID=3346996 RepID=UPI0036484DDC